MTALTRLLRDRLVVRLLAAVGVLVLIGQIAVWYPRYALHAPAADDRLDFLVYGRAADRAAHGQSPYEACVHERTRPPHCFFYPPPFAAAIALFGRASPNAFQAGAYLVLLLAFWAYAAGLVRLAWPPVEASRILIVGVLLFLAPGVNVTMSFGNLDLVVWALVAWGLTAERALPLLVIAAAFKIWPAIVLVNLLVTRPARLRPAALTAVAILAGTVAVGGTGWFSDWFRWAVPGLAAGTLDANNISLVAVLARHGIELPGPVVAALPIVAALLASLALRRRPERLRAAVSGVVACLCASIFWAQNLGVLLIPLALWLASRRDATGASPLEVR
jgi:hypothetical protein